MEPIDLTEMWAAHYSDCENAAVIAVSADLGGILTFCRENYLKKWRNTLHESDEVHFNWNYFNTFTESYTIWLSDEYEICYQVYKIPVLKTIQRRSESQQSQPIPNRGVPK